MDGTEAAGEQAGITADTLDANSALPDLVAVWKSLADFVDRQLPAVEQQLPAVEQQLALGSDTEPNGSQQVAGHDGTSATASDGPHATVTLRPAIMKQEPVVKQEPVTHHIKREPGVVRAADTLLGIPAATQADASTRGLAPGLPATTAVPDSAPPNPEPAVGGVQLALDGVGTGLQDMPLAEQAAQLASDGAGTSEQAAQAAVAADITHITGLASSTPGLPASTAAQLAVVSYGSAVPVTDAVAVTDAHSVPTAEALVQEDTLHLPAGKATQVYQMARESDSKRGNQPSIEQQQKPKVGVPKVNHANAVQPDTPATEEPDTQDQQQQVCANWAKQQQGDPSAGQMVCDSCGTTKASQSPGWCQDKETGTPACPACYTHKRMYGQARPPSVYQQAAKVNHADAAPPDTPATEQSDDQPQPQQVCANCGAATMAKHKGTGSYVCSACDIYQRLTGRARPYRSNQKDGSRIRAAADAVWSESPVTTNQAQKRALEVPAAGEQSDVQQNQRHKHRRAIGASDNAWPANCVAGGLGTLQQQDTDHAGQLQQTCLQGCLWDTPQQVQQQQEQLHAAVQNGTINTVTQVPQVGLVQSTSSVAPQQDQQVVSATAFEPMMPAQTQQLPQDASQRAAVTAGNMHAPVAVAAPLGCSQRMFAAAGSSECQTSSEEEEEEEEGEGEEEGLGEEEQQDEEGEGEGEGEEEGSETGTDTAAVVNERAAASMEQQGTRRRRRRRQQHRQRMQRVCTNCGTASTSHWCKDKEGDGFTCDMCYRYQRRHGCARPPHLFLQVATASHADAVQPQLQKECTNCGSTTTGLQWCRDKETGLRLCQACHAYQRRHGCARPSHLFLRFATASHADAAQPNLPASNTCDVEPQPQKVCTYCGSTRTGSRWYKDKETGSCVCIACYTYRQRHGCARPHRTIQAAAQPQLQKVCSNCGVTKTSQWCKDKGTGSCVCHTCYEYQRVNGRARPYRSNQQVSSISHAVANAIRPQPLVSRDGAEKRTLEVPAAAGQSVTQQQQDHKRMRQGVSEGARPAMCSAGGHGSLKQQDAERAGQLQQHVMPGYQGHVQQQAQQQLQQQQPAVAAAATMEVESTQAALASCDQQRGNDTPAVVASAGAADMSALPADLVQLLPALPADDDMLMGTQFVEKASCGMFRLLKAVGKAEWQREAVRGLSAAFKTEEGRRSFQSLVYPMLLGAVQAGEKGTVVDVLADWLEKE